MNALTATNPAAIPTASVTFTATAATVPTAPTLTGVVAGNGQVEVAFTPPINDGGFPIENDAFSVDDGATWVEFAPAVTTGPALLTRLPNEVPTKVRLRALNAAGAGPASNALPATPRHARLTVTELVRFTAFDPQTGERTLADTVTFPNGPGGFEGPGFDASFADGDRIVVRVEPADGTVFAAYAHPNAVAQLFLNAVWQIAGDPTSVVATPEVTFVDLVGAAPAVGSAQAGISDAGKELFAGFVADVNGDATFTAIEIAFTVPHALARVNRTYPSMTSGSAPSFGVIAVGGEDLEERTLLALVGPPTTLAWTSAPEAVVAGEARTLGVEVHDAAGNRVLGDADRVVTITAEAADGTAIDVAPVTTTNGAAVVTLVGTSAGVATLRADAPPLTAATTTVRVDPAAAAELVIVAGDDQRAALGATLAAPPTFRVEDPFGNPVSGVEVRFTVASGDGTVDPPAVTTAADGLAEVTWTLGARAGEQTLSATAGDLSAVIAATATPGTPSGLTYPDLSLAATYGTAGSSAAPTLDDGGEAVRYSLAVESLDEEEPLDPAARVHPMASVAAPISIDSTSGAIAWSDAVLPGAYRLTVGATNGGGTTSIVLTLTSAPRPLTASGFTVGAVKVYDATRDALVTPGTVVEGVLGGDQVTLTAVATFDTADVSAEKTITLRYEPSGIDAFKYLPRTEHSFTTGEITPRPIRVRAEPAQKVFGAPDPPLSTQVITGELAGSVAFQGAPARTPGEAVGAYAIEQGTLTAGANYALEFDGRAFTITPKDLNDPDVVIAPIPSQTFGPNLQPPVVVHDRDVPLVRDVDFTVSTTSLVAVGTASVAVTGIGNYAGSVTLDFEIVRVGADRIALTGPAFLTAGAVSEAFTLSLLDAFGDPTAAVTDTLFALASSEAAATASFLPATVMVPAGATGGSFAYVNERVGSGVHTITAARISGDALAGGPTATHTLTVQPGSPARLVIRAGDAQVGVVDSVLPVPPLAQVTDAFGNAVGGVAVSFEVTAGFGRVDPATVISDAEGFVTANWWRLGPQPGLHALEATLVGSGGGVVFTATAEPHPETVLRAPTELRLASCGEEVVVLFDPVPGADAYAFLLASSDSTWVWQAATDRGGGISPNPLIRLRDLLVGVEVDVFVRGEAAGVPGLAAGPLRITAEPPCNPAIEGRALGGGRAVRRFLGRGWNRVVVHVRNRERWNRSDSQRVAARASRPG